MGRLIAAELLRMRSRRAILLLGILGLVLTLFVAGAVFFSVSPSGFPLADANAILIGFSVGLAVLSFALGGTFMGSDWHHGLVGALLTWEPRRGRVLGAKAIAVALVAGAGAALLQLVLVLGLFMTAAAHPAIGRQPEVVSELLGTGGRVTLLVVLMSLLGTALAHIARSTAIGVGIGLAWIAIAERVLEVVKQSWGPWLLGDLSAALVSGGLELAYPDPHAPFGVTIVELNWQRAAAVLGAYVLGILTIAWLLFRRRDVT